MSIHHGFGSGTGRGEGRDLVVKVGPRSLLPLLVERLASLRQELVRLLF